jgi:signal transduction histidine kinase
MRLRVLAAHGGTISLRQRLQWHGDGIEMGPHLGSGIDPLGFNDSGVPGLRRYMILWVPLGVLSAIVVIAPNLTVATYLPQFSIAVSAVSGAIGLALLQLGLLRFRLMRRPLDLHAGLAFGTLAVGNLFAVWAFGPTQSGDLPVDVSIYFLLLARATAAILFLTGLPGTLAAAQQGSSVVAMVARPLGIGALVVAIVVGMESRYPVLLDPGARELVRSGRPILDFLQGQATVLVAADTAIAAALCVAAIGYTFAARRLTDPYISVIAAGLAVLFFAQVQAILFPPMAADYLSTGDVVRLAAYALLVSNLVWRTAADVGDRTARGERMRLSRELHDGLAQQLALLQLRLARAIDAGDPSDQRARELDIAQRLVEAVSLEAREAIAALRTERVSWEKLDHALTTFADEFSQNHDVDVRVSTTPDPLGTDAIDGLLEAELLRILHEGCSNAIRHGRAKVIEAQVTAVEHVLRLVIRDDGQGFELAHAQMGVGLRSMAERVERHGGQLLIDAAWGRGTSIQVSFPLSGSR